MSAPLVIACRSSSGFEGSRLGGELLDPLGVDPDAAGEVGHLRQQVQPQPLGVPEQPRVGELAHGEVEPHLVDRDVEPGAEGVHVLGDEGRLAVFAVEQRDADVAARDDLVGELADHLAELHREQGAADVAHELAGVAHHAAELLGRLLLEHAGERVGDRGGDRFGELGPDRHGRLGPAGAGEQRGFDGELGDAGRLVEPEGGDVERLLQRGPLRGGAGNRRSGGEAAWPARGRDPS